MNIKDKMLIVKKEIYINNYNKDFEAVLALQPELDRLLEIKEAQTKITNAIIRKEEKMTNPVYEYLSNDEKSAIVESTVRNLEFQMYQTELQLIVEKARKTPDADRIAYLEEDIKDKQNQIAAIKL